jgi:hypothetical protein
MTDAHPGSLSARLLNLTSELRALDTDLKSQPTLDSGLLQEFRQVLDNARMTAWTVHELLNARATGQDRETVLSFLAAERLRRIRQMIEDLCFDIDQHGITWQTSRIQGLFGAMNLVQDRLSALTSQHQRSHLEG